LVVVDGGECPAGVEPVLVEVDVRRVQGEGLALAQSGADEYFDEVGEVRVVRLAVVEEAHGLGGGPDGAFCGG
jgi:hypothetical protein